MVWVVTEHSSCAVMGMFSTAFRHLALMMFCMPCGQLGVGFFLPQSSNQSAEEFYQQQHKLLEMCQLCQDCSSLEAKIETCTKKIKKSFGSALYLLFTFKSV